MPRRTSAIRLALCLCLALFWLPLTVANASPSAAEISTLTPAVVLNGKAPMRELKGYIDYLLDPSQELDIAQVLRPEIAGRFRRTERAEPAFGYRADNIWLRIRVENRSDETEEWKLHLHNNFMQVIDIYVVRPSGGIDHVLSQTTASTFDTRPLPYHQLVADLRIRTGELVELFIKYRSGGHTGLQPSLESNSSFQIQSTRNASKAFLFQGVLALLILAGVLTFAVLRTVTTLTYALYLLTCSVFLLHWDGYAFQYLWPGLPVFNADASLVIGCALVIASTSYARSFLKTRREYPVVDKVLLGNILLASGLLLAGLSIDTQPLKKAMIVVACMTTVLIFAAGANAARRQFKEVRFFLVGWFGVILSAVMVSGRHLFDVDLPRELALDGMRMAIVFDALMMGLALLDRYAQDRAAQRRALQENLAITQRNLDMHGRLSRLELRYGLARDLAEQRGRRLADTTHDLRQPLHALRLTVQGLVDKGSVDPPAAGTIEQSFEYVEALVEQALDLSTLDEPAANGGEPETHAPESSGATVSLPVDEMLRNLQEMFRDDAATKGLRLRRVPCAARVAVDPLTVMRILSNLVANAVKYTDVGRILIGCRRRGERLSIEVHDTGPGLSEDEFAQAMARSVQLSNGHESASGHGLGLSIVAELTARHGIPLRHSGRPGAGTCVAIEVPVATVQESAPLLVAAGE